jgi:hypothetical protein
MKTAHPIATRRHPLRPKALFGLARYAGWVFIGYLVIAAGLGVIIR